MAGSFVARPFVRWKSRFCNTRGKSASPFWNAAAKTVIFACKVDRFSRVLREQMAVAMPYLYEYLQKIDVLLGESYAFVGNDAYSGLAFGREPARGQPRGAQYAAVFREHPGGESSREI